MNELFSTQAGNFVNALETSVDPRTGQFMVNLPLVSIAGNRGLGPELSLSLSYSPLNSRNYGFGNGFSLGISRFNNKSNSLELSSGETYRVTPGTDNVNNQKLDTFRFMYTNGSDDSDGYTITWKEGVTEFLTDQGDNNYVLTSLISPLGRTISVEWSWNGREPMITEIKDETTLLCRFTYDNVVIMTMWPDTKDEYQTHFYLINDNQLDTVTRQVSGNEFLSWYLGYSLSQDGDILLLTDITYPTGMKDHVEYSQIEGHMFPSSSGVYNRLPVVITHIMTPGGAQPETIKMYSYTQHNFLGYNGNFGNWEGNNDYIYTTLTDYTYGSIETIQSGADKLIIERVYNNYHLLVSEETCRNQSTYRKEMTYYAQPGVFIDSQPAQFQLTKMLKETWTDSKGAQRTQTTETEFDVAGNPVYEKAPDGTETITNWYKASGETGCPAEPNGFTRFIKSSKTIPRKTSYSAPVMETQYTFSTLSKNNHIVQSQVENYADDVLLSRKKFTYNSIVNNSEYGRILFEEDSKYTKGAGSEYYTSTLEYVTTLSNGRLITDITFTGHDGLTLSTSQEKSVFSGKLLSEKNGLGVVDVYTYDKAGRLLTQTHAPETVYTSKTTCSYSIENNGPVTTISDSSGNQVKVQFDGVGRETGRTVFDSANTQKWYQVSETVFNEFGEEISRINHDWLTHSAERYSLKMLTTIDNWGNAGLQSASDGTRAHAVTDPIMLSTQVWMDETSSVNALGTGKETTQLDMVSQLPVSVVRTNLSGDTLGHTLQEWDGLGRMCLEQDERENITLRTYDVYGRLLSQSHPDGTIVSRTYAPHLIDEMVTSITITGPSADGSVKTWQIGTQEFDSLGRLTKASNGGRTTRYVYENAGPEPSMVITPAGKEIHYTRIPELGNVLSSVQSEDMTQQFTYEPSTGWLTSAEDVRTETVNRNSWYSSGLLKKEEFIQNGTTCSAGYTYTLEGEIASYTDINGNQTQYKRDAFGRVDEIDDTALTTMLEYDALGRLSKQIVRSKSVSETLTTQLEYDDFGRECLRTITDSNGEGIVITQIWHPGDLLESRIQKNLLGELLRTETFSYDCRNRMTEYVISGTLAVEDAYGNPVKKQVNHYDALNNLTRVSTTLTDDTIDTELHHYSNGDDPMQLTSVTHTHPAYPELIALKYDDNGNMICDESGRTLEYDIQGRLKKVQGENINGGSYGYDALNRLVTQHVNTGDVRELYYRGHELVNEVAR